MTDKLTRDVVEKLYTVREDGIITTPGKFEMEQVYAPYLYFAYLNGESTYYDEDHEMIELTKEDKALYKELVPYDYALLRISEQGFVWCSLHIRSKK